MTAFKTMREDLPWGEISYDVAPTNIEEALTMSGLDWEVIPKPALYLDNVDEIDAADDPDEIPMIVEDVPNYFVNVRSDNGTPLGIVTKRYAPFHNIQAFGFLSEIFASEMDFVAAGTWMNSRRVWVLMKLPEYIEVGGDEIERYALVHTSHDGKHSVTAAMTPMRVGSKTMVTAEIKRARDYNAQRVISLRHVGNMEVKIEEARHVLEVSINYYEQFKVLGDRMAEKMIEEGDIQAFVEELFPIDEDKQGERAQRNAEENRQELTRIYNRTEETGGGSPGSWWALYNAAVEFADWGRSERKQGGRFQRAIDDPDSFKTTAFELALGGCEL